MRVVRFLDDVLLLLLLNGHHLPARDCSETRGLHLPALDCSETRRTSSAALRDFTCQFLIAAGLARLFAASNLLWASPDFYALKIAVGLAGLLRLENCCGPRQTFCAGLFEPRKKTQKEYQIRMPDQNARKNAKDNVRWNAR